jgi:hypothetical protein
MSLVKDEERLELLKEIGGTKVYEERRRDSLKVMHETEGRRAHIEEVVSRAHLGMPVDCVQAWAACSHTHVPRFGAALKYCCGLGSKVQLSDLMTLCIYSPAKSPQLPATGLLHRAG